MATKNKTNKSVKKRIKVTATGKLKHGKVGRRHLERAHDRQANASTSPARDHRRPPEGAEEVQDRTRRSVTRAVNALVPRTKSHTK